MQTVGFSEGREEAHRVRIRLNSESGSGSSIFSSDNHERRPEHAGRRRALLQVRRKPVWKDRMKVQQRDYTKLSVFLLDVNRTPGLDSRKRYKRVCARIWHEFKVTLLSGHVNCLLVFLPVSIAANLSTWDPALSFALNYLAIIPLVSLVSYATQEESFGMLPHAIFCNAAELITMFLLLREGGTQLLNSFILGSLVNNLLFICGTSMFFGGVVNMTDQWGNGAEQYVSHTKVTTAASLLGLFTSLLLLISLPLASSLWSDLGQEMEPWTANASRSASLVLITIYLIYLWFSMRTHQRLFTEEDPLDDFEDSLDDGTGEQLLKVDPRTAVAILCLSLLMLAFCIMHLIWSFAAVKEAHNWTDKSLGFILIPLACSGAKHGIAVDLATKNHVNMSFAMALEPSVQLSILLMPIAVVLGWITGDPIYLRFDLFETIAVFLAVLVVMSCITDGKTNYLKGAMMFGLYIVIILAMYVQSPL